MRATGIVRRIDDLGRVLHIFLVTGKNKVKVTNWRDN